MSIRRCHFLNAGDMFLPPLSVFSTQAAVRSPPYNYPYFMPSSIDDLEESLSSDDMLAEHHLEMQQEEDDYIQKTIQEYENGDYWIKQL